jgi:hypothetical protein
MVSCLVPRVCVTTAIAVPHAADHSTNRRNLLTRTTHDLDLHEIDLDRTGLKSLHQNGALSALGLDRTRFK